MKKLVGLALSIVLATAIVACGSKTIIYKQGTYEGNAEGHIGLIKVKIVTDQYEIKEITILEQQETPVIAEIVYDKIPPKVIKANSPEVEVVAGATYTSNGLINAIKDGLDKAKIKVP
ncbi:FMN-binding protein [Clostridium estertheticum]|uniref:FMN-binding protein n=1 Tax=Clostridium estertheticum TaxID=238834 RepID=UPI0013E96B86|nr:FMN-binding protein [Clostridium estertheticum]MBZ9687752.1 FMN-binding protein [Clostridium estertheticum]